MDPYVLTVFFLQLNSSGLSWHKLVALNEYPEGTDAQVIAPGESHRTISNVEFANFEVLQSSNPGNKGGKSLLIRKRLSFYCAPDLKTNKVDAFSSIVYLDCFTLLVASVYIPTDCDSQMNIFIETLRRNVRASCFRVTIMPDIQCGKILKSTITETCLTIFSINSELIYSEPQCAHDLVSLW